MKFPKWRKGTKEQVREYDLARRELEANGEYEKLRGIKVETRRFNYLNELVAATERPLSSWQRFTSNGRLIREEAQERRTERREDRFEHREDRHERRTERREQRLVRRSDNQADRLEHRREVRDFHSDNRFQRIDSKNSRQEDNQSAKQLRRDIQEIHKEHKARRRSR